VNAPKPSLLLFTSLYPYPWMPTRAVFNFQQYRALEAHFAIAYLVPVPFFLYFRHLRAILKRSPSTNESRQILYFPMFYLPGLLRNRNPFFLALSALLCIRPALQLWRAERVMASWAYPDAVACALLARLRPIAYFVQCLGSDVNVHQEIGVRRAQLKTTFEGAKGVITVSRDLADKVRAIAPTSLVSSIYNGVDFLRFQPVHRPAHGNDLLFIGNLIRTKGVFELVEAFATLSREDTGEANGSVERKLHFIGDGPERAALEALAAAQGIADACIFHGRLAHDKVATLLAQFALLVLPSYNEGVPNVVVEALACGIPVVASRVGGIPEVLSEDTGMLIDGHAPGAIAEGIAQVLARDWDKHALRHSVEHLTWSQNAEALTQLLMSETPA
jgi:glycosyltransferase involved in cell wall biosynthesis